MLKLEDILQEMNLIEREQYRPMLSQINIADFYKCIAQFSGLHISKINDEVMYDYLYTWCVNKYKFFKMLGNKVRLDQPFEYNRPKTDLSNQIIELGKTYPAYYLWLKEFKNQEKNKIEVNRWWDIEKYCRELFPQFNIDGSTMTHFFKAKLNAPDELVTAIGRLFENDTIAATHTISIDPVDMMLASENPYDWNSCYRLELNRTDSHADGCLAAVLDMSSLITYVWSTEGQYDMYSSFKFKKIRYYRMRQWIAISDDWGGIHFNTIYPGKGDYDKKLEKLFREVVEKVVSKYIGVTKKKKKNDYYTEAKPEQEERWWYPQHAYLYDCFREFYYGYNEYDSSNIYINSEINPSRDNDTISRAELEAIRNNDSKKIRVYNHKIMCPCGCGVELMGSDEVGEEEEEYGYNGEGFIAENFYEREQYWCDYKDDYCDCECNSDCCEGCPYWEDAHPYCEYAEGICPNGQEAPDIYDGTAHPEDDYCSTCPHWKACHPEANDGE